MYFLGYFNAELMPWPCFRLQILTHVVLPDLATMNLPSALLFFHDHLIFTSALFFCQQREMDVSDLFIFGQFCLVLYNYTDLPTVTNFVFCHHGVIPNAMINTW
jgi:hypothetical protein